MGYNCENHLLSSPEVLNDSNEKDIFFPEEEEEK